VVLLHGFLLVVLLHGFPEFRGMAPHLSALAALGHRAVAPGIG